MSATSSMKSSGSMSTKEASKARVLRRWATSVGARMTSGGSHRTKKRTSPLIMVLCVPFATACQQLDPHLADGVKPLESPGGSGGGTVGEKGGTNGGVGDGGSDLAPRSCDSTRSQVRGILETNCAFCHQAPAPGVPLFYAGTFDFILELDKITSLVSPNSPIGSPLRYVVPGDPDRSYIFQRFSNGTMPPVARMQRPTAADTQVLNQWITTCIDGGSGGWLPPSNT